MLPLHGAPAQRLGAVPPPVRQGGLPRWARVTMEALAEAALPAGQRVTRPAGPVAGARMDQVLAELPRSIRWAIVAVLLVIEWSALLLASGRFSRLPVEKRLVVLDRWHRGPAIARLLMRGLLTPIKVAYYAEEDVAAALGYQPKAYAPKPGALDGLPPGDVRIGREQSKQEISCDVVVIGTGAGGAVVAKELAELGRRVVMVEEGQYWTRPQFTRRSYQMTRLLYRDWGFTVALGYPGIPIPLGRAVGGTTVINSGTCLRVPERTLDRWRQEHGISFNAEELAEDYQRVEGILGVQPVSEQVLGHNARVVARGAEALGLHPRPLTRNATDCAGSGVCCFGCPEDAKRSTNVSYVPAALAGGATLYTETLARRIVLEGGRAAGLECAMGPEETPLRVRAGAVVISAGTIYTPLLMARQGLGRRSGQLGRNLSIHPATKVYGLFAEEIRAHEGVPQGLAIDDLAQEGIMFEGIAMTPDFASVGFPFYGPKLVECMERYTHLASFGFMVEDESRGRVRRGPDGRPLMLYSLGPPELARLQRGMEVLCRIFFKAGAQSVYPPLAHFPELTSEADCDRIRGLHLGPADVELTAFHPLGTCRMATDPRLGVLDPDQETWEVDRLFVADGSIFPSSLGVNPQLTIMAFSTRAARQIHARLGGAPRRPPA